MDGVQAAGEQTGGGHPPRAWLRSLKPASDDDTFTLDAKVLSAGKAQRRRFVHAVQIPLIRAAGFVILCLIAALHDIGLGTAFPSPELLRLWGINLGYAALSWAVLWFLQGRSGRLDLSLVFLHLDLLVWLPTLRHIEEGQLLVALLLLIRVSDQVGFGVRRALYFAHLVALVYLGYTAWLSIALPAQAHWHDRMVIAATLYLVGIYLALTGRVTERLRQRMRSAVHAARDLVEALAANTRALEAQARELEAARLDGERANAAKSVFLAMMSHEIRTPMNGVLGATELLAHSALDPAQRRLVETAQRSGAGMLALIDDLLDLSRIEAGKLTLAEAPFAPRALFDDVIALLTPCAQAKSLRLVTTLASDLPQRLTGDAQRLRQVLTNLLGNAVKFTEEGEVELRAAIDGPAGPDGKLRLRVEVRDSGPGIAASQHAAVFDAFMQVDASSTRRHGGSGLGLAIVKQLVELMGGEVGVASRPGGGSTFWFSLWLAVAEAPTAPPDVAADTAGLDAAVLLAEDNPVNQLVLQRMLELLGCRVDTVGDGQAAVAAAAARHYDVVLMDLHMPVMDGFQATERILATASRNGATPPPIVALSAAVLPEDRRRSAASGMVDFISKPVGLERLRSCIAAQLPGRRR